MPAAQFAEWLAYYSVEPFGEERADLRNAILCRLVANALRGKGRRAEVEDFMPKFGRDEETSDEARMIEAAKALARVSPG